MIKGVPLDAWTDEEVKVFFWACVGWKIGTPGAQNNAGTCRGNKGTMGEGEGCE